MHVNEIYPHRKNRLFLSGHETQIPASRRLPDTAAPNRTHGHADFRGNRVDHRVIPSEISLHLPRVVVEPGGDILLMVKTGQYRKFVQATNMGLQ